MNDYLGNIMARTLSPSASVRPQLLSIFEPPPANSEFKAPLDFNPDTATESFPVTPVDATLQHSVYEEISSTREEPEAVQPLRTIPPFLPTPGAGDEPLTTREDRGAASVQPRPPHRVSAVGTTQPAPEDPANRLRRPSTARQSQPTAPVADALATPSGDREVTWVQPPPRPANDVGTTEKTGEERIGALPLRPSIPLEPTMGAAPVRRSISTQPTVVRPSVILKPAADPDHPQHESVQGPAIRPVTPAARISPPHVPPTVAPVSPTIHVTIGRVEVRATPPLAARPRPQAAGAPVMTLEEYLRQRASGGSR